MFVILLGVLVVGLVLYSYKMGETRGFEEGMEFSDTMWREKFEEKEEILNE